MVVGGVGRFVLQEDNTYGKTKKSAANTRFRPAICGEPHNFSKDSWLLLLISQFFSTLSATLVIAPGLLLSAGEQASPFVFAFILAREVTGRDGAAPADVQMCGVAGYAPHCWK